MAYFIGISGGSGSGKTTFVQQLKDKLTPNVACFISLDHYYKELSFQPKDINGVENFDQPESIDVEQFYKDLDQLLSGKSVERLEYNFNNPNLDQKIFTLNPAPIFVIEGIFLYAYPKIMQKLDLKIFIDAPDYIRIKRRMMRDTTSRGYTVEDVLYRLEFQVEPAHESYVEPFKHEADIIIPNKTHFTKGLDVVVSHLLSKLH